jgi:hypothetical protein
MNNTSFLATRLTSVNGPFDKDVSEQGNGNAEGSIRDLQVISYNAQKSWTNLTALLETHGSADIVVRY